MRMRKESERLVGAIGTRPRPASQKSVQSLVLLRGSDSIVSATCLNRRGSTPSIPQLPGRELRYREPSGQGFSPRAMRHRSVMKILGRPNCVVGRRSTLSHMGQEVIRASAPHSMASSKFFFWMSMANSLSVPIMGAVQQTAFNRSYCLAGRSTPTSSKISSRKASCSGIHLVAQLAW